MQTVSTTVPVKNYSHTAFTGNSNDCISDFLTIGVTNDLLPDAPMRGLAYVNNSISKHAAPNAYYTNDFGYAG